MAVTITSTADKEVTVILAESQKQSEIMKGEGDGLRIKSLQMPLVKILNFSHFIEQCRLTKKH